jgi:hypothetical protein
MSKGRVREVNKIQQPMQVGIREKMSALLRCARLCGLRKHKNQKKERTPAGR